MKFPATDSWLGQWNEAFESWSMAFWAENWELGFRVSYEEKRTTERRREERENVTRMKENGCETLLYMCLGRVNPNPTHYSLTLSRLIQILMDLDQSNAPGALVWSGSIRSVGLGRRSMGFKIFVISWILLLIAPFSLLSEPTCMPNFLQKFQKNLLCILDMFLVD